jgi:hypothetical protein
LPFSLVFHSFFLNFLIPKLKHFQNCI